MNMKSTWWGRFSAFLLILAAGCSGNGGNSDVPSQTVPESIQQIFNKPFYQNAAWGMRVVDLDTGQLIYNVRSDRAFLIGSVRKMFSVGLALDALGSNFTFRTPVYRQGTVSADGVLTGNLVLVASGDMAMGGRTNPDGTYAIGNFDHNEANSLGNSNLTAPDPLAGYNALAAQVAASGIKRIAGEVIIDDRLFEPFNFREEFDIRPIFVNDNVVDVILNPGTLGGPASFDWRPKSAAFSVQSNVLMTAPGSKFTLGLTPELPSCIGLVSCSGTVAGTLPTDFVPPLTGQFPLIRTFRIVQPANYSRTVFIEALARAGVTITAPTVAPNPTQLLPAQNSYANETRVAELVSLPYKDYAKHILKVSYNIGADTSLMLYGLSKGVRTITEALAAEQKALITEIGIGTDQFHFIDGSGGGRTTATNQAVIKLLEAMARRATFPEYLDAQPRLGVDGSLATVTDFEADASLAGAKGQVQAKTGTYIEPTPEGEADFKAQSLAGYIHAKSGRRLAYTLVVNDVGLISGITDVITVFQDMGTISAILWRDQ